MRRYPTGDPVTAGTIEAEDWYPDYESLVELKRTLPGNTDLVAAFNKQYLELFKEQYADQEQLQRWVTSLSKGKNNGRSQSRNASS